MVTPKSQNVTRNSIDILTDGYKLSSVGFFVSHDLNSHLDDLSDQKANQRQNIPIEWNCKIFSNFIPSNSTGNQGSV